MPSKLPRRSTSERLGQCAAGPAHHDDAMRSIADLLDANAVHVMTDSLDFRLWECVTSIAGPNGDAQLYER